MIAEFIGKSAFGFITGRTYRLKSTAVRLGRVRFMDWTGNKKSVYAVLGASNHVKEEREEFDYYATDPKAIDALLDGGGRDRSFHMGASMWTRTFG